jgi:plasmid stabilization system protein ParE
VNYRFLDEAEAEFNAQVVYYEEVQDGLGLEFAHEVFSAINRIGKFPSAWTPYSKRSRRCLLRRFPFAIVYRLIDEEIVIFAIMQLNREPDYWRNRLK